MHTRPSNSAKISPQYLSARQALNGFDTTFSEAHVLLVQVEAVGWQVTLGQKMLQFAHQHVFDHSCHKKIAQLQTTTFWGFKI